MSVLTDRQRDRLGKMREDFFGGSAGILLDALRDFRASNPTLSLPEAIDEMYDHLNEQTIDETEAYARKELENL